MDLVFRGYGDFTYPEGKDANGRNLGLVRVGDIRDLDGPPDRWWREATDEDRAALAARDAAEAEPGQPGTEAGSESGEAPDAGEAAPDAGELPPPDMPVPTPPAVIPGT